MLLSLQISIAIFGASQPAGQQNPQPTLNNCEMNDHNLDTAHHLAGDDSVVVAIAHLGTGERNRDLNRRRLHNVRAYLTEFAWKRRRATVVTAEGERVNGYGRIDIYVRGTHWASLAVRRNADLIVGLCEPDYMRGPEETRTFYPFRDRKKP
jgi:hypothetical protein